MNCPKCSSLRKCEANFCTECGFSYAKLIQEIIESRNADDWSHVKTVLIFFCIFFLQNIQNWILLKDSIGFLHLNILFFRFCWEKIFTFRCQKHIFCSSSLNFGRNLKIFGKNNFDNDKYIWQNDVY